MKKSICAIACWAIVGLALTSPAGAQSDWTQFFYYSEQGITFYYSPSTVAHDGNNATAKWHDSSNPGLVYLVQIDCSARTIQSLSVDRYDPQSGSFIETVDLRDKSSADPIGPQGTMASNLAQAIC